MYTIADFKEKNIAVYFSSIYSKEYLEFATALDNYGGFIWGGGSHYKKISDTSVFSGFLTDESAYIGYMHGNIFLADGTKNNTWVFDKSYIITTPMDFDFMRQYVDTELSLIGKFLIGKL